MSIDSHAERNERQAMLYHGDGLLDILMGLGILIFGLTITFDMFYLSGAYIAILAATLPSMKKAITAPRLRSIEDPPLLESRRKLVRVGLLITLGLGVLLLLGVLAFLRADAIPAWLITGIGEYGILLFGVALVGLLVVTGWATGQRRMIAYAAMAALASAAGQWLGVDFWLYVTLVGSAILVGGVAVLIQFLREHPKTGVDWPPA